MRPFKKIAVLTMGIIAFTGVSSLFAEDPKTTKIEKKDVPSAVMTAFTQAFPKVAIKEIESKEKDGMNSYEFEWVEGKLKHEAVYGTDGTLLSNKTKEPIKVKSIPEAVKNGVNSAYPKAKISKVEKVTDNKGSEYSVCVQNEKENLMLILDDTGKILETKKNCCGKGKCGKTKKCKSK